MPAYPTPFKTTGGARIGWTNATWPLAKLSANPELLTLSATLLGSYDFAPHEVKAITRYVRIPVLGWGIQILHNRSDYPERMVFWSFGSPDSVLRGIHNSGFTPAGPQIAAAENRGLAARPIAIAIAIIVWNGLLLVDMWPWLQTMGKSEPRLGVPTLLALLMACLFSVGTLVSKDLQEVVLKPDRKIGEIRHFLTLLALISGFLFVIFTLLFVAGVGVFK